MRTGRCQCGEIRYKNLGTSHELYICHCGECQKHGRHLWDRLLIIH